MQQTHFMYNRFILIPLLLILIRLGAHAQNFELNTWYLKDPATDSIYGISLPKAYQFLQEKKRKSVPVIVAVLDSGVDTTHEDLKKNLCNVSALNQHINDQKYWIFHSVLLSYIGLFTYIFKL